MSVELVARSLRLDLEDVEKGQSKKSSVKESQVYTARQGINRKKRKLERKKEKEILEKRKGKKLMSAIEKYKEENCIDNTESNVEALLRLTELGKVNNIVAEKILYKQPCQLSRDLKVEIIQETKSTVFTDEDFKKFSKEYKKK
ncbi:active regulator of SIRT1-like [Biomphalaria glabrata]|uniref:Active regulator of SIRT1-like n=1 Tax=Biomphalaria glabrata TaxID=6526 RepID=A0A9U8E1V9_BIOGL|nr:active regulator of SIRT1-like [Biomphalaria glabrata]